MQRIPPIFSIEKVESPCVRNCCLDMENICVGCGRNLDDITRWTRMTEAERAFVCLAAAERRAKGESKKPIG